MKRKTMLQDLQRDLYRHRTSIYIIVAVKWTTGGYTYVYYAGTYLTLNGHIDMTPGNVYKIVYKSYNIISINKVDR